MKATEDRDPELVKLEQQNERLKAEIKQVRKENCALRNLFYSLRRILMSSEVAEP